MAKHFTQKKLNFPSWDLNYCGHFLVFRQIWGYLKLICGLYWLIAPSTPPTLPQFLMEDLRESHEFTRCSLLFFLTSLFIYIPGVFLEEVSVSGIPIDTNPLAWQKVQIQLHPSLPWNWAQSCCPHKWGQTSTYHSSLSLVTRVHLNRCALWILNLSEVQVRDADPWLDICQTLFLCKSPSHQVYLLRN